MGRGTLGWQLALTVFVTDSQQVLVMSEFPRRENGRWQRRPAHHHHPGLPKKSALRKEQRASGSSVPLWAVSRSVRAMRTPRQLCCASSVGNFHGTSVRQWPPEMLLWCPGSECASPTADRGAPMAAQIACQSFGEEMGQPALCRGGRRLGALRPLTKSRDSTGLSVILLKGM